MTIRFSCLLLLAACSSEPIVTNDASPPADAKSDIPSIGFPDAGNDADASLLGDGCPSAACPTVAPAGGSACSGVYSCEYGDAPLSECDTVANCNGSTWQLVATSSPDGGWCVPSPQCPASFPDALDAGACPSSSLVCHYAQGTCGCESNVWKCIYPQNPSCPAARPRIGTACTGSLSCQYGQYCSTLFGDVMDCRCGTWQQAGVPCPPPPPSP